MKIQYNIPICGFIDETCPNLSNHLCENNCVDTDGLKILYPKKVRK